MKFLVIQENGRHEKNREFRECFSVQRSLSQLNHECDVWGLGHKNYAERPDYNSYDVIIDLENYDTGWLPNLSSVKAYKIIWAIDTHVRGNDYYDSKFIRNKCQLILQATRNYLDNNSVWFPNCFDSTLIYPMQVEKRFDVGFCGNVLNRGRYFDLLSKHFNFSKDIFVIGEDMVRAINSYRVHFNKNISTDVNYRNFETLGCGVILATSNNPQYDELGFKDGENCIIYSDDMELISKIKDVMVNESVSTSIAKAGYLLSQRHTYLERMKRLVSIIEGKINDTI